MLELPVYLDHAATTPLDPAVLDEMLPYLRDRYGNASSLYHQGAEAREAVESAREIIADAIHADPEEIFFTSGGTEADNWAIKGIASASSAAKRHLLVSPIEHSAVLSSAGALAHTGFTVELLKVDMDGFVEPGEVARRIRSDTCLVSVMHANNEIGTIEPVEAIGAVCRERGVPFHVDAVQSFGKLPLDVRQMNVDLLSLSAHKIYGPKGVGALYIRRGVKISPFFDGGEQESGRRGGTINVPGVVGFGGAVKRAEEARPAETKRLTALRDRLIDGVVGSIKDVRLTGSRNRRLPNNVHLCIGGVEGESMLLALDATGIAASAGSACSSGSVEPSHVLLAIGLPVETARGALRLSLGRSTTAEAVDYTVDKLSAIVAELRSLS